MNAGPAPLAAEPSRVGDRLARFAPRLGRRHSVFYSHFVWFLKVVLPATALGLAMILVLWPQLAPQMNPIRIKPVAVGIEDLENLRMVNPRFVGTDAQDQPFTITADLATQPTAASTSTQLEHPKGDIGIKGGAWVALSADRGLYDKKAQTLDLDGAVNLFHDRGYEIVTDRARIFLDKGLAEGDAPVRGQGPDVELDGEGFRLEDKGARIFVTGRSRLKLFPASRDAPPASRDAPKERVN